MLHQLLTNVNVTSTKDNVCFTSNISFKPVTEASPDWNGDTECGMERRVGVVCAGDLMKGDKTRELGGYKLLYNGADESGRNGVRIVLSGELKNSLVRVNRRNDQVMGFQLGIGETVIIIWAYALCLP